jgi:hypothetical protein
MGMMIQTAVYTLGKRVGSFLLGGIVLWQVAEHTGATRGQAVIHVANRHVDVTIDHEAYRIEDLSESPIVRELRPGRHTVRMSRDGQELYQEEFVVVAGEDVVLAVCEPRAADPSPAPWPAHVARMR